MTLSGDGDSRARREKAKDRRRDITERRPWLLRLLIAVAVAGVVAALVFAIATGTGF
ncbi:MAG: hypothetical protein QM675_11370 [Protaetiibacter sp.]